MSFDLAATSIVVCVSGSHAHGTAREGSDVDLRGVCVAPLAARLSLGGAFEQHEGRLEGSLRDAVMEPLLAHPTARDGLAAKAEVVVFDVAKLLALCGSQNPNALELLFGDPRDVLLERPPWARIREARHRFLTRRVRDTFLGYALGQLRKIRTHRGWLLSPPGGPPERRAFGLPEGGRTLPRDDQHRIEQALQLQAGGASDEGAVEAAADALDVPRSVLALLDAERSYRHAQKHWASYETWKRERNPARAELERAHGYDTKHAMHLVRLLRMGREALETGDLAVRRPDADELRAIRDGAWSFERLEGYAADVERDMARAGERSSLPEDVDRAWLDELFVSVVREVGLG